MCMALYIASDSELPIITQKTDPDFWTIKADSEISSHEYKTEGSSPNWAVKKQFSKQHIYYLGSGGDSCGFLSGIKLSNDGKIIEESKGQKEEIKNKLINFMADALEKTDELELFSCHAGGETNNPEIRKTVDPEFFLQHPFSMDEVAFYKIIKTK